VIVGYKDSERCHGPPPRSIRVLHSNSVYPL